MRAESIRILLAIERWSRKSRGLHARIFIQELKNPGDFIGNAEAAIPVRDLQRPCARWYYKITGGWLISKTKTSRRILPVVHTASQAPGPKLALAPEMADRKAVRIYERAADSGFLED